MDFLVCKDVYCGKNGSYMIYMDGTGISGDCKLPDPLIVEYNNPNVGVIKYAVLLKKDFKTKMIHRLDQLVAQTFFTPSKIDEVAIIDDDGVKQYSIVHKNGNLLDNAWWNLELKVFNVEWKTITYPGVVQNLYKISNLGHVVNIETNRTINQHLNSGYKRLELRSTNDIGKIHLYTHVLVVYEFLNKDFINSELVVNHIDGNKTNNRYDNLEIITQQENVKHGWLFGLNTPNYGENNGSHILTLKDVELICKLLVIHDGNVYRTRQHLVDFGIVLPYEDRMLTQIKYGKNWKSVSQKYFEYRRNNKGFVSIIKKEDIEL